ncbi:hypothetical protein DFH09DRAFT_1218872 [Mycena vulgaris]|nr:hypothetical protein DFH09DRAFT_1218872 [Mycena vulgaris]
MHPLAALFNPSLRVYNLRLLLLANIVAVALVFRWPIRGLAALDLALVAIELGVEGYLCLDFLGLWLVPLLIALAMSAVFRIATIVNSKGGLWSQQFEFLGCCMRTQPAYTPLTILLTRTLRRPLVRCVSHYSDPESRFIIFARALVLTCIALGVPAFGLYMIFVKPLSAQVYARTSTIIRSLDSAMGDEAYSGSATIYLNPFYDYDVYNDAFADLAETIRISGWLNDIEELDCPVTRTSTGFEAQCTQSSFVMITNLSISIAIPPEIGGVYVRIAQGYVPSDALGGLWLLEPTPLLPGSHLFGLLFWTRREIIPTLAWGLQSPSVMFYSSRVVALQPYPSRDTPRSNIATLTLVQPLNGLGTIMQDTVDVSPLSALATFGGFWTFVNGAFALVFGANVVYFGFGWRPLSALGIVHLFQRRELVRRWHEDFPAIHTEGGTPGSESAGIVAFIRERLVDVGQDPLRHPEDIEAQIDGHINLQRMQDRDTDGTSVRSRERDCSGTNPSQEARYVLDELPLLDVDLGLVEVVNDAVAELPRDSIEGDVALKNQDLDSVLS